MLSLNNREDFKVGDKVELVNLAANWPDDVYKYDYYSNIHIIIGAKGIILDMSEQHFAIKYFKAGITTDMYWWRVQKVQETTPKGNKVL